LIVRHSGLREVTENEVLAELTTEELRLPREVHHIDTRPFIDDVADGNWQASESYLIDQAGEVRRLAEHLGDPLIKYYGLAEIAHVVALGAFIGDERPMLVFDFDRDFKHWQWPVQEPELKLRIEGLPLERILSSGRVAVRVEISASIQDADVQAILGFDVLADVRIRLASDYVPKVKTVASAADAHQIREALRSVLASLNEFRPGTEQIHLFVAASAPVCLLLGQELRLRNNPPFQTYRYRHQEAIKYQEAILLTATDAAAAAEEELTDAQVQRAQHVRSVVWARALREVQNYAELMQERSQATTTIWYESLTKKELLTLARPPVTRPIRRHRWAG
jgi:hypothetical protein